MTIYSFLVGKIPWHEIKSSHIVQEQLKEGNRPNLKYNIPKTLKKIIQFGDTQQLLTKKNKI